MSDLAIRRALESRLATWATSQSLDVAWENVDFTPTEWPYLRAYVLPAPTDSLDLAGEHRLYSGVFQVSVIGKSGRGSSETWAIAEAVAGLYPLNTRISGTGVTVLVLTPVSIASAINEADEFIVPVSFRYRVDKF